MSVDSLWLDAKQAILDEQFRRWRALSQAGQQAEADRQCGATLACAADLLNESLQLLDAMLKAQPVAQNPAPPPSGPSRAE